MLKFCTKFSASAILKSQQRTAAKFTTVPLFYANSDPHIGHLYSAVIGDASHRWEILKEENKQIQISKDPNQQDQLPPIETPKEKNLFVVGTDEHGTKISKAAQLAKTSVKEHVNIYSDKFRNLYEFFNISFTDFLRTSDPKHQRAVVNFWNKLKENGYIYKEEYTGWYSIVDECFYSPSEIEHLSNKNGDTVAISKETGNKVELIKEENYMFALSKFQDKIRKWLVDSDVIMPKSFVPFVLQLARKNINISISRDATRQEWGIPVPGDPTQTIYVWLDALVGYLTAAGYPAKDVKDFQWPPNLQIIGKDILRFHAIYWPAFLMAAGLPLPEKIFVHSHWLVDKLKMSKSVGNVIDPFEAAELLTADGLRYFLLKQGVPHQDTSFTFLKAISVINTELVNNLGNLIQRATNLKINPTQKYPGFDLEVMEHDLKGTGEKLVLDLKSLHERVTKHYDAMLYYRGLETISETIQQANAFFQLHEPWKISQGEELATILFLTYETCRICNVLLQPIVPDYADKALTRLGISKNERHLGTAVFGGGPSMKIYGRPLGIDNGVIMERIKSDITSISSSSSTSSTNSAGGGEGGGDAIASTGH